MYIILCAIRGFWGFLGSALCLIPVLDCSPARDVPSGFLIVRDQLNDLLSSTIYPVYGGFVF